MKMQRFVFVIAISLSFGCCTTNAQDLRVCDMFPLAVGYSWTYQYWVQLSQLENFDEYAGIATYSVVAKKDFPDSTLWSLRQIRDINRTLSTYFGGVYERTHFIDTSSFTICENLTGNHRLTVPGSFKSSFMLVFPFTLDFSDSLSFFRYASVDSTGKQQLHAQYPHNFLGYFCTFTFESWKGVSAANGSSIASTPGWRTEHKLLSSVITSVTSATESGRIDIVRSAFPNPFNPSTSIEFSLGKSQRVQLEVYDLLGRCVAKLLDREMPSGVHTVRWNALGFSSGIYLLRTQIEGRVYTQRIVLLK